MGLVNAVWVVWGDSTVGGNLWVEDEDSIEGTGTTPAWGRREGFLSLSGARSAAAATELARQWMSTRSQPSESLVVEVSPDAEPKVGDVLPTVEGHEDVKVVGVSWKLDRTGELVPTPEVSSLLNQRRIESDVAFERMVAASGGRSSASATVELTGVPGVESGPIQSTVLTAWSASGVLELEDMGEWHAQGVQEPCRVCRLELTGKPEPEGDDFIVELLHNGESFPTPVVATLQYNHDRGYVNVFSDVTLFPDQDLLSVEILQIGVHADLAIKAHVVKAT